jgi:hypothetical protein
MDSCACGRPARGDGATTSPATGAVAHYCRQCSVEHCELDRYLLARHDPRARIMTTRPCMECGHRHEGPALAGICVGCPCPVRFDGSAYPVQANADRY